MPSTPLRPHLEHDPFRSTTNVLDSLVGFYQQEQMWVYRTRASLELAFTQGPTTTDEAVIAESDPMASVSEDNMSAVKAEPSVSPPISSTLWLRRKKKYNLRLEGIAPRGRRKQPGKGHQSRVRILEMFENLMEARMESCQRINKLVKNANRAALCYEQIDVVA
jgi:hypothetical protein